MTTDDAPGAAYDPVPLPDIGLLRPARPSPEVGQLFAEDRAAFGYVMNLSHVWAHLPGAHESLSVLMGQVTEAAGLMFRRRGVLVSASASTLGDPHCSLAWEPASPARWGRTRRPECSAVTTPGWTPRSGFWPTGRAA